MVNYFQTNPYKFPQMKGLGFGWVFFGGEIGSNMFQVPL